MTSPPTARWEGRWCEVPICGRTCGHGGHCVAPDTCGSCAEGWGGAYCGNADGWLPFVAVVALLVAAGLVVLPAGAVRWRREHALLARGGPLLLAAQSVGGAVWLYAETAAVAGDVLGFLSIEDGTWFWFTLKLLGIGAREAAAAAWLLAAAQVGLGRIVAHSSHTTLSHCRTHCNTTVHPLHTVSTKRFGHSFSETTTRPNPTRRCTASAGRRSPAGCRWPSAGARGVSWGVGTRHYCPI